MWLLMLACAADPLTAAGQDYARQMQPLLVQNRAVGEQFLQLASKIKKGEADGALVAAQLQSGVIGPAKTMSVEVSAVRPQNSVLVTPHGQLSSAWRDRAEAYASIAAAYTARDTAAFDKAVLAAAAAADAEAQAADRLNAELLGTGIQIDFYP